jgi:hypothetical protein
MNALSMNTQFCNAKILQKATLTLKAKMLLTKPNINYTYLHTDIKLDFL